ncbi:hypothetical protein, partial [Rhizobium ecuadorense]|uniref:hypothetical protein n=1 Tax=Rhizobium ecuadorense TaxID=1671795 RepID=UPI001364DFE4
MKPVQLVFEKRFEIHHLLLLHAQAIYPEGVRVFDLRQVQQGGRDRPFHAAIHRTATSLLSIKEETGGRAKVGARVGSFRVKQGS